MARLFYGDVVVDRSTKLSFAKLIGFMNPRCDGFVEITGSEIEVVVNAILGGTFGFYDAGVCDLSVEGDRKSEAGLAGMNAEEGATVDGEVDTSLLFFDVEGAKGLKARCEF
jgi:hypothetical protein